MPPDATGSDFQAQIRKLRDCLQSVDFLYQLKVEQLDHLMGALKKRHCPAGYTVIKQGDPGDALLHGFIRESRSLSQRQSPGHADPRGIFSGKARF